MKVNNWSEEQAKHFIEDVSKVLNNDPYSRVSKETMELVKKDDCIYDVHCHIFDRKTLKIGYILLRMCISGIFEKSSEEYKYWNQDIVNIYNKIGIVETEDKWDEFENELDKLELNISSTTSEESLRGKGLKDVIKVLKKGSMKEIFEFYTLNFSLNRIESYEKKPFVTGILMMDLETGWRFNAKKSFVEQVDELNSLSKESPILPFLAIDPRRAELSGEENLYAVFKKAFIENDSSFFGIKCYPSLGYFPSDKRLEPIFKICEEFNIPVTTHCGGESVSTFDKHINFLGDNGYQEIDLREKGDRKLRARYLNDPIHWVPVLEKFPNLKVNLAHFGTDFFWDNHIKKNPDERIKNLITLLNDNSKRVYTDFSYNLVETSILDKLKDVLENNPKIHNKILYGTDFWVVLPNSDLLNDIKFFLASLGKYSQKMVSDNVKSFLFE